MRRVHAIFCVEKIYYRAINVNSQSHAESRAAVARARACVYTCVRAEGFDERLKVLVVSRE